MTNGIAVIIFRNYNFAYDLKEAIDKVLSVTAVDQLYFIGYTFGALEGYYLLTNFPEYNSKITLFINVAPMVYWESSNNSRLELEAVKNIIKVMNCKMFVIFVEKRLEMLKIL